MSEYWKRKGVNVATVANLTKAPVNPPEEHKTTPPVNPKNNTGELEKTLTAVLPEKKYASEVAKIIIHEKTKQAVNTALTKTFPPREVGRIYKAIKPLIADKKGS